MPAPSSAPATASPGGPVIGLLPGSRRAEISRLMPVFADAVGTHRGGPNRRHGSSSLLSRLRSAPSGKPPADLPVPRDPSPPAARSAMRRWPHATSPSRRPGPVALGPLRLAGVPMVPRLPGQPGHGGDYAPHAPGAVCDDRQRAPRTSGGPRASSGELQPARVLPRRLWACCAMGARARSSAPPLPARLRDSVPRA